VSSQVEVPQPRRGWSSKNLEVVPLLDPRYWSVFDAASLLGPPKLSESQVRDLIHLAGLEPAGKRHNGSRRRHIRVYLAENLIEAYDKIAALTGAAN
jgi:hypothetical protein